MPSERSCASAFELSMPMQDGTIAVHYQGDPTFAATRLVFRKGTWAESEDHSRHFDIRTGQCIVDVRKAIAQANERFPQGVL